MPPSWTWQSLESGTDDETRALNGSIGVAKALQLCEGDDATTAHEAFRTLYSSMLRNAERLYAEDNLLNTFMAAGALLCRLGGGNVLDACADRRVWDWAVREAGALDPATPGLTPGLWLLACVENLASLWRTLRSTHLVAYVQSLWSAAACVLMSARHRPHTDDLLPITVRLIDLAREATLSQPGMEPRMGEARPRFHAQEVPQQVQDFVALAMTRDPEQQDTSEVLSDWLIGPGDRTLACFKAETQVDRDTVLMTYGSWTGQLRGFPDLRGDPAVEDVVDIARFATFVRAQTGLKWLLQCYIPRYRLWQAVDSLQQQPFPVLVGVVGGWAIVFRHPHTAHVSVCVCPTAQAACFEWLACVVVYCGGVCCNTRLL